MTPRTARPGWSRGAAAAVAGLGLLAVAALAGRAILTEPAPRPTPTRAAASVAFPSAEPSFDVQLPLTTTEVAAGRRVSIEGSGPRQIAYRVADGHPVVARLDCRLCHGTLVYLSGGRPEPLAAGRAPWVGEHLLNTDPADRRTLLRVDAAGAWTLSLVSAADLSPARLPASGSGPRVLLVDAPGSAVEVTATGEEAGPLRVTVLPPADAAGAAPGVPPAVATGQSLTLAVPRPALVAVEGAGPWTLVGLP